MCNAVVFTAAPIAQPQPREDEVDVPEIFVQDNNDHLELASQVTVQVR